MQIIADIQITEEITPAYAEILTPDALAFIAKLQRAFGGRRQELLQQRKEIQEHLQAGQLPTFLPETAHIRESEWQVAAIPDDLQQRWVEITGPTERKMMINALNSGADVFMADLEDANTPAWSNVVEGQINLRDAIDRTITFTNPDGKAYQLKEQVGLLIVRPRGWHLDEKHLLLDGHPMSGSLVDFGFYFFHNARRLLAKGSGPYFYLPKMESYLEARLWNDVFVMAQQELGLPIGTIKVTVLLEHILLSFQIDEVLYELRDHIAGINAGRWDYIFSAIKKFRSQPDFLLPDRAQVTMTVPFMRAYTQLLVQTCHRRGAHAMGGMAAFIPSRRDAAVNEVALQKVREDKLREVSNGFDGTWVAHPDLVPVARQIFEEGLKGQPNQKERIPKVEVQPQDLINFKIEGGAITEAGLRNNISVALQYIEAWLRGNGAVAIFNLMEDAATAEISRSQLWQWVHHPDGKLNDGRKVDIPLVRQVIQEELAKIKEAIGENTYNLGKFDLAEKILDGLVTSDEYPEFLTVVAYQYI
jgi:malate synthase